MGILAIYDITGIQDFIFSTPKLKEIIGASKLVEKILEKYLPDILSDIGKNESLNIVQNWRPIAPEQPAPDFAMLVDSSIDAEVLYIGGGNAWVAYKDKGLYEYVNELLSLKIFKSTYELRLVSVGVDTDFSDTSMIEGRTRYERDTIALQKALKEEKKRLISSRPAGGISITKQSVSTGQPVVMVDQDDQTLLSRVQVFKRIEAQDNSDNAGVTEFDAYTLKGEDSLLAVSHIDGNNIGASIGEFIKKYSASYQKAIPAMRSISNAITNYYKSAVDRVENKLRLSIENECFLNGIDPDTRESLSTFRRIILNGDDVTLVCYGKIAMTLIVELLLELAHHEITVVTSDVTGPKTHKIPVSACAGICYFNSHFPFSVAYHQAETCCTWAKLAGREKKGNRSTGHADHRTHGSWVDFFVNASNYPEGVDDVMAEFSAKNDSSEIPGRPYCVHMPSGEGDFWVDVAQSRAVSRLENGLKYFNADKSIAWPRGKSKALRDALSGESDPLVILNHMKAQRRSLDRVQNPERGMDDNEIAKAGKYSVCYDALEMMDLFERLPEEVSER